MTARAYDIGTGKCLRRTAVSPATCDIIIIIIIII